MTPDKIALFWSRIDVTPACWLWTAATSAGYGRMRIDGESQLAHRVSYQIHNGSIPAGLEIDHICRVRLCVNPDHLQAVSSSQNSENQSVANTRTLSGLRGVHWYKTRNKWMAHASSRGKFHFGGYFDDLRDAEQAAKALRNRLHTNNVADRIPA
jgi:hypothetical protein